MKTALWIALFSSSLFTPIVAQASSTAEKEAQPETCTGECNKKESQESAPQNQTTQCSGDYCQKSYSYSYSEGYESDCGSWESTQIFGARTFTGGSATGAQLAGVGAYLRSHWSHLGVEASIDSSSIVEDRRVAGRFSAAGAFMLYANSDGALRGYGLWGLGVTELLFGDSSTRSRTKQLGGGLELDLSERFSLDLDLRRVRDNEVAGDLDVARSLSLPTEFVVGSLGLNLHF